LGINPYTTKGYDFYQNSVGNFFSVGFGNDCGGYKLNTPNDFKGCISTKVITTFRNKPPPALFFEGFGDFLSCDFKKENQLLKTYK
jgi:hypothetical protein